MCKIIIHHITMIIIRQLFFKEKDEGIVFTFSNESTQKETVWSLSKISVRILRGVFHNTRGLGRTYPWCTSSYTNRIRWVAMYGVEYR